MLSDCYWAGKKVFFCKPNALFIACRKKNAKQNAAYAPEAAGAALSESYSKEMS